MTRAGWVLRRPRFTVVVAGEGLSMAGSAAFDIALAWTVLASTGSIGALSAVLLCQAVPRGVLLLLGGAVVDRYSPRAVMMLCHVVRGGALGVLAVLALIGTPALWQLCGFAVVMGVSAAFFSPASESVIPTLVEDDELGRANALQGVLEQLALVVGPLVGGLAVASVGVAAVYALDALTFLVAAGTVTVAPRSRGPERALAGREVLHEIVEGLRHARDSHDVRVVLLVLSAATLSYSGVFAVGLPALATSVGDAAALGLLVAGWGAGQLVGALCAAVTGLPTRWGTLIIAMTILESVMFMTLGLVPNAWAGAALLAVVGIGVAYSTDVALPTFVQRRTPRAMLGRVSAVLGLPRVIFEPVSIAVLGLALSHSLELGFALAALPMLLAGLALLADPRARSLRIDARRP